MRYPRHELSLSHPSSITRLLHLPNNIPNPDFRVTNTTSLPYPFRVASVRLVPTPWSGLIGTVGLPLASVPGRDDGVLGGSGMGSLRRFGAGLEG